MTIISENRKSEILTFLLTRTQIWFFNSCIKSFNTDRLYYREKQSLLRAFPELEGNLNFAIIMCDIMNPYRCAEIECKDNELKLNKLKYRYTLAKRYGSMQSAAQYIDEYNALVDQQNKLLAPQNALIKLFKSVKKKQHDTANK